MSKTISWIILLGIFSSLSTVAFGKTCTKEYIHTYLVHRLNTDTRKLVTLAEMRSSIIKVCCEGYRENSRTIEGPICEPYYCRNACDHGVCYGHDLCKCDDGYQNTEPYICVPEESLTTPPTRTTPPKNPITTSRTINFRRTSLEEQPKLRSDLEPHHPVCSPSCLYGRCKADNHCECLDGYAFDSELLQCKPLCNGKFYGCIRGTCVGYNQCRCDNGTALLQNELYHCQSLKEDNSLEQNRSMEQETFNWVWYLLIAVLLFAVVFISFYIIIKRWRRFKANRLEAQDQIFSEIRYFNPENGHSVNTKHQRLHQEQHAAEDGPSSSRATINRNGNVVIIST